jgi:hypothetical protein
LEDRDEEGWQPLFALLSVADPNRVQELQAVAEALTRQKADADRDDSLAVKLLGDIRTVFETRSEMATTELIHALSEVPESPWNDNIELSPRKLARMLKPFGVSSRQLWEGGKNVRGYHIKDLRDAFSRYLSSK